MLSNAEKQRRFKEKMYEAGFKQTVVWVKRKEVKAVQMKQSGFMKRLEKITAGWNGGDLSELYNLFIKMASAKKEVIGLRKTDQSKEA
jgi:hypothetical protein